MSKILRGLLPAVALVFYATYATTATAQESPTPSRLIESYQTWKVECTNIAITPKEGEEAEENETPKFRKVCEATQTYTNPKTGNEFARTIFAYDQPEDGERKLIAGFRTFVDVSLDEKPKITVEDETLFEGKLTRCSGVYCFGRFEVETDKLDQLKESEKAAIQYRLSNGRLIKINISNKGLADALTSLEAK